MDIDRRTGRSFRTCLYAVLEASQTSNLKILLVFPTHQMGMYHFRHTLLPIMKDLGGVKFYSDHVTLPNGSDIRIIGDQGTRSTALYGARFDLTIHDHPV